MFTQKRIMSGLGALLFILCMGTSIYALENQWQKLNNQVSLLYRQGHYDRSVQTGGK